MVPAEILPLHQDIHVRIPGLHACIGPFHKSNSFINCVSVKDPLMDNLLQQKNLLEERLTKLKMQENDWQQKLSVVSYRKKDLEGKLSSLKREKGQMKAELQCKVEKTERLKRLVEEYKNNRLEEVTAQIKKDYNSIVREINSISFTYNYSTFSQFARVRNIFEMLTYKNLRKRVYKFYLNKKEQLKLQILNSIRDDMTASKKMHRLVFGVKFLVKFERFFEEQVFLDFLYCLLSEGFQYHFCTSKESNRLDKPEWIFDFLVLKYTEYFKVHKIYVLSNSTGSAEISLNNPKEATISFDNNKPSGFVSNRQVSGVDVNKDESERKSSDSPVKKKTKTHADVGTAILANLIHKSSELIHIKFTEILQSRQKRNLLLHFAKEFLKYCNTVKRKFNVSPCLKELGDTLYTIQKAYIIDKLESIHRMRYIQWFNGYQELAKESFYYYSTYSSIDTKFNLRTLIDPILQYNNTFVDNLRYVDREEIRALCLIFSNFEDYKLFLCEQENEMLFDSNLTLCENEANSQIGRSIRTCENYGTNPVEFAHKQPLEDKKEIGYKSSKDEESAKYTDQEMNSKHNKTGLLYDENSLSQGFSSITSDSHVTDIVLSSLENISAFNHENLKLLKSLALNDTTNQLRSIRNFKYKSQEVARKFLIETSRMLEDYKTCISYSVIENSVKDRIDSFLLDEILLKSRFETDEYFEFREFLGQLKKKFKNKDWKSDVGCKCVEYIFEGKECKSTLFKIIRSLYD